MLAGLILALTYALVARFLIRRGGDPLLAYFVSMTAAVLSAAHWLARPHLFTMLAVVAPARAAGAAGQRKLWPYFALFVIWANLHGGFFYGCITHRALRRWASWPKGGSSWARRGADWFARARHHLAAAGPRAAGEPGESQRLAQLLAHVAGFFGNSAILAADPGVHEPRLPHHQRQDLPRWCCSPSSASLALSRRRPPLPVLLILLANVAFALISQRNIELFALVALPLVALHLDAEWRALPVLRRAKEVFQREHEGAYSGVGAAVARGAAGRPGAGRRAAWRGWR